MHGLGLKPCRCCSAHMAEVRPVVWRLATRSVVLNRPLIMGIVNVTPDSFSDGGLHVASETAIEHGLRLAEGGADVIDIGGESTRPGAEPVSTDEETARVLPVVEALASAGLAVSIDTTKPQVARAAMDAGAEIINDVTAAEEPEMASTMAVTGAGVVLMHMQGTPRTMQRDPHYDDVVIEVRQFLMERAARVEAAGVSRDSIMIDPGIGFGKTGEHNLELLDRLGELVSTGYPVLVGASRKSFLGRLTGIEEAARRDVVTAATTALVVAAGGAGVRVHDVESSRQAGAVAWAMVRAGARRFP